MPKSMWRPPRLRISDSDEQRHATWMELFYDLLFAAVVAQLALRLGEDLSSWGLISFGALFVPV